MGNYAIYVNPKGGTGEGGNAQVDRVITIDSIIGSSVLIVPNTANAFFGFDDGSTEITGVDLQNAQVDVRIGNIPLPATDPGNGDMYFNKDLSDGRIILSQPLSTGDLVRIIIFGNTLPATSKVYPNIDLTSDYTGAAPGIYEIIGSNGTAKFIFPEASSYDGSMVVVINDSDNTVTTANTIEDVLAIAAHDMATFYSINNKWYGK